MLKNKIYQWPQGDQPREKLLHNQARNMSNTELIGILFGTGSQGHNAVDLARLVINRFSTLRNLSQCTATELMQFRGLGAAKAARLKAALELAYRLNCEHIHEVGYRIDSAQDAVAMLTSEMRNLNKEVFKVVLLNARNRVIESVTVEEGTVTFAQPILRELFHHAIKQTAAGVICVHNHPSGNPQPSSEDRVFTQTLKQAGEVLQIRVLDHIIIGDGTYYSFADQGAL